MRVSSKARYGLAVMVTLAKQPENTVSVMTLSQELSLSKIYLEQVLNPLKTNGLVLATKGAQGGYRLVDEKITVKQVLQTLEPAFFEVTSVSCEDPTLNRVIKQQVYDRMQEGFEGSYMDLTLRQLAKKTKEAQQESLMFYI
jgi:Rrf2 family protein